MKLIFVKTALLALSVALFAPLASAATITFNGTDAAGDTFSGVLFAHPDLSVAGAYDIFDANGSVTRTATSNTQSISLGSSAFGGPWDINNPQSSPGNVYTFDNLYYSAPAPGNADGDPFDGNGILLVLGNGKQINMYFVDGTATGYFGMFDGFGQSQITSFSAVLDPNANPTITPEPGSLLLFGTGVLGLAGTIRRRITA